MRKTLVSHITAHANCSLPCSAACAPDRGPVVVEGYVPGPAARATKNAHLLKNTNRHLVAPRRPTTQRSTPAAIRNAAARRTNIATVQSMPLCLDLALSILVDKTAGRLSGVRSKQVLETDREREREVPLLINTLPSHISPSCLPPSSLTHLFFLTRPHSLINLLPPGHCALCQRPRCGSQMGRFSHHLAPQRRPPVVPHLGDPPTAPGRVAISGCSRLSQALWSPREAEKHQRTQDPWGAAAELLPESATMGFGQTSRGLLHLRHQRGWGRWMG